MRLISLALSVALLAAPAHAPARADAIPPLSLQAPVFVAQVEGDFDLDADGVVVAYRAVTVAPEPVAAGVERFVRSLRFRMQDDEGRLRPSTGRVRLTLVRDVVDGVVAESIRVENLTFPVVPSIPGTGRADPVATMPLRKVMPRYPDAALAAGVRGSVLAAILVGTDGSTERAMVRQLSLRGVRGDPRLLTQIAAGFEARTLEALKRWRFSLTPPGGAGLSAKQRSGVVTVRFVFEDSRSTAFQWTHETRSVLRDEPWLERETTCCRLGVSDMSVVQDDEQVSDRFELVDDPRGRGL